MELPNALRLALERELHGNDGPALAREGATLSAHYRHPYAATGTLTPRAALAYATVRMPATFAAAAAALGAVAAARPDLAPVSLLDAGAGTGAALWAAAITWEHLETATLLEQNETLTKLGQRLARSARLPALQRATWQQTNLLGTWDAPAHDLVTATYVLGELPEAARPALVAQLWERARMALVLVEPGTPHGWAVIRAAREQLQAVGAQILAPCPHQDACPLPASDWCHFAQRLARSRAQRAAKGAERSYEDEKYSYVAVGRAAGVPIGARILRHPVVRPGHIGLTLCTTSGLQQMTITRSAGERWRQARDARWGDALPAEFLD
ncbi:MAG: small ribosomal subunit Rsm22 family protein [Chloroflexi bacterium OHK40]